MRIAIIGFNDFIHDGRQQRIARSLQQQHEVKVFGIAQNDDARPEVIEGVPTSIIALKTKKLSRHPAMQVFKYAEYYCRTIRAVAAFRPDALLVVDISTLPFALFFRLRGIPFVYCANEYWRGTTNMTAYNSILFKALLLLEGPAARRAYRSFTVCGSIADEMQQRYRIRKPLLVRNIPDTDYESGLGDSSVDRLRQAAGLDAGQKIALHVGGITSMRGLATTIRSVAMWNEDIFLVFLGDGYLKAELIELRNSLGLQERVIFLDPVPQNEVLEVIKTADAGIVSFENTCRNYYYALPNKFFQQALMRIPLLTSAFPEMKPIVDEYRLGDTFDPTSAEDIADKVNRLIESGFAIDRADHERFASDYSWRNEEARLLGIFTSLERGLATLD
ncbi:MAG: glycosyltransferase [Candidatus Cloacimonetes bacterium]|nr:glycosyltransferase [Candidatus Cloacimonadota bacterium]